MRILFLDQFSDLGGAQLCLQDVLLAVKDVGWDGEVAATGAGPLLDFARAHGFAARSLPATSYANGYKTAPDILHFGVDTMRNARLVRGALRERPADLVYINGPRVLPAAFGLDLPVLFHSHSLLDKRYARAIAYAALRKRQASVLACSEFAAEPLRSMPGCSGVRVIYNGVLDHGFRPRKPGLGPVRVGILGRIAPEKGHLDFLRVAGTLRHRQDLQFSITGAALFSGATYEQSVRSAAAAAGVVSQGWTTDVSQVLHDLDILVVPSAGNDASPRVILEALSAGTCIVAYPSGGIPELIRNGHSGVLTTSLSTGELTEAIQVLAANPDLRARLAVNGRREWGKRFRVDRFRQDVCDAISHAVTSRAPDASGHRSTSPAQRSARDGRLSAP